MSRYTLHCSECAAEVTLAARRLLVRLDAQSATSGEVVFTCLMCGATNALELDVDAVALLVSGGVTFLSLSEPVEEHPESPPEGPPLTADDVLDLHAELDSDDWFGRFTAYDAA